MTAALAAGTGADELDVQASAIGHADARARVSGGIENGMTWQASYQHVYRGPGAYVPYVALERNSGSYGAFRVGGLGRLSLSDRTQLELGAAIEPFSTGEGLVIGLQNPTLGPIAAVVVTPLAMTATAEATVGVRTRVSDHLAIGASLNPSAAVWWFTGDSIFVGDHSTSRLLEAWQPSVGVSMVF